MTYRKYGGEDAQWNTDPTAPVKTVAPVRPVRYADTTPLTYDQQRQAVDARYDVYGGDVAAAGAAGASRWPTVTPGTTYPPTTGGGGGGSGSGVDPNRGVYDSLAKYLADLGGQDVAGIYNTQLGNIASSYAGQIAGANQRFDSLGNEVGSAGRAGRARMGDIVRLMQERGLLGQQAAQQSFGQADTRLADLQSQFGLADQGNAAGVNKILSAFDAGSVDAMQQPTQNLFQAARGNTAAVGGMYDQNFVDRSNVSENIGQDINRQLSAQEQSLMNQIAVRRAQEIQQLQQAQAAAEFAIQQQLMAAQQQKQAQEAAVRLEMAKLGITG